MTPYVSPYAPETDDEVRIAHAMEIPLTGAALEALDLREKVRELEAALTKEETDHANTRAAWAPVVDAWLWAIERAEAERDEARAKLARVEAETADARRLGASIHKAQAEAVAWAQGEIVAFAARLLNDDEDMDFHTLTAFADLVARGDWREG